MISVIIPAHNEEKYIERCIKFIQKASTHTSVETIVVCNRCTDSTADIASSLGVVVLQNDSRSIAAVRNAGIKAATGDIIVTIDADNRMTPGTLKEIEEKLSSGKYIGGGAPIRFERYSFPLFLNDMMIRTGAALTGCYSGIFWAKKETFDAIGGFVDMKAMEDVATAKKLKAYGKKRGLKYGCLKKNYLINSTRKFDDMGDWLYFKLMVKAVKGGRKGWDKLVDEMFYEYNDKPTDGEKFSVIIPAHNEEKYIASCIESIKAAATHTPVEIIVVCNRCTDNTAAIASSLGAVSIIDDSRSIAAVRNAGIKAATGDIIVTIDADSTIASTSLKEVEEKLHSGKYIGGGSRVKFDRASIGIAFSALYVAWNLIPTMIKNGATLSGAMFWFRKTDWEKNGGFDETLVSLEDMDFAVRLNRLGKEKGLKYGTLKSVVTTSARKFDEFGDWYLIRERKLVKRIFTGKDREAADKFYYDVRG